MMDWASIILPITPPVEFVATTYQTANRKRSRPARLAVLSSTLSASKAKPRHSLATMRRVRFGQLPASTRAVLAMAVATPSIHESDTDISLCIAQPLALLGAHRVEPRTATQSPCLDRVGRRRGHGHCSAARARRSAGRQPGHGCAPGALRHRHSCTDDLRTGVAGCGCELPCHGT